MSSLPVMLVVFDTGSLTPWEISTAAAGLCELVFVVSGPFAASGFADSPDETRMLLDDLAKVVEIDGERPDLGQLRALNPQGIVTFSDSRLELSAAIAADLGLRFHSVATAAKLADKTGQRIALTAAGLPSPRFAEVTSIAGIEEALAAIQLPAVLKPTHGAGSRDTYRIDRPEQARDLVTHCLTTDGSPMILEEMIVGDPQSAGPSWADIVSVESLFVAGQPYHVATTGRFPFAPPFRETGSFTPSRLNDKQRMEAIGLVEDAARALGVVDGFIHTELKLTADGMRVVEVNGRLGGFISWLLRRGRGIDVGVLALRSALRLPLDPAADINSEVDAPEVAFQRCLVPPVGARRFEELTEVDQAFAGDGIDSVHFWGTPGQPVDWTRGYGACLGIVSGAVPAHDDLDQMLRTIDSGIQLTFS